MTTRQALLDSIPAQIAVAEYFANKLEFEIKIVAIYNGKSDAGDIFIRRPGEHWRCIEVKGHPTIPFDRLDRYPWILVDKLAVYTNKPEYPEAYFILGSEMEHALVVKTTADTVFSTMKVKDKFSGELEECIGLEREAFTKVKL